MGFLNFSFGAFGKKFLGNAGKMFRLPELSKLPIFILSVPGAAASAAADNQEQVIKILLFYIFPVLLLMCFPQGFHMFPAVIPRIAASAIFYAYLHVLFSSFLQNPSQSSVRHRVNPL